MHRHFHHVSNAGKHLHIIRTEYHRSKSKATGSLFVVIVWKRQIPYALKRVCPRYIFTRMHTSRSMNLNYKKNAPGKTRTCCFQIRNLALYPDELRGLYFGNLLATFFSLILKIPRSFKALKNKDLALFMSVGI